MLKNQKGITLVALVVTIVVLIILATISISIVLNSGLTTTAESAEKHQANADQQWTDTEANVQYYVDDKVNTIVSQ